MSCSVCRLPFIPDPRRSTSPLREHTPSEDVVPKDQATYFMSSVGVGSGIMGCVQKCHYYSANMFGSMLGFEVLMWESHGGTFFMAHRVCLSLLRHALKVEDDSFMSKTTLCAHEVILGRPQGGMLAGRLKDIDYEHVGEKVDLSPFWRLGPEAGCNIFEWKTFKAHRNGSLSWIIQRPDIFPRFNRTVSSERLASVGTPPSKEERADLITTMPLELILHLLRYLSVKSYVALVSTCRFLRYHAFTTFQSHARCLVLQLPWALPTRSELEEIKEKYRAEMAGTDEELRGGDWFLYLHRIHGTKSMRVRRWIWALCEEIRRVWMAKLPRSAYADLGDSVKSPARIQLEEKVKAKLDQVDVMRLMNERAKEENRHR
ncbi:hypothetical protein B0H19DRAFT_1247105 [Mycena capillaripes]|nr:hypothetical protein B0H19DRAFT_1247105 [Mycena capillaripes]